MSTINLAASFAYNGLTTSFGSTATLSSTQSGSGVLLGVQTIGTTAEAIALGDLANVRGGFLLKNEDATNYVEIDSANTFDKFPQKILPGGFIFLAPQTLTIYAKANTAAISLSITAAEA